jgi:hypothetical protein
VWLMTTTSKADPYLMMLMMMMVMVMMMVMMTVHQCMDKEDS